MTTSGVDPGSFRDPSGFVFRRDGVLYRQVNQVHRQNYDLLMDSGLYEELVDAGLMVPHEDARDSPQATADAYKIIRPEKVGFVSYPYEWCFGQLRDAALVILDIQKRSLARGLSLRDASAYNIQFHRGRPVLIDTLSFEVLEEGRPWVAYRQFCQHFIAPLALMSYRDVRLCGLLRTHIDGIPLDLAAALLPGRARLRIPLLVHIFLHSRSQRRHAAGSRESKRGGTFGERAFRGLIESLESGVRHLSLKRRGSHWSGYYEEMTHYDTSALDHKRELVSKFIEEIAQGSVWDLGGNVGLFARLASDRGIHTVCFDLDPMCVEENYRKAKAGGEEQILPLVADLTNPSPAIGWANEERKTLADRGPADLALALALIHHLAIGNNVPLIRLAEFLARLCRSLVVEFIPKEDVKVQQLLANRDDIFEDYTRENFERAFKHYFDIDSAEPIRHSDRVLYLMHSSELA